jgi:hypothetical protein
MNMIRTQKASFDKKAESVGLARKRDVACSRLHAGQRTNNARDHNKQKCPPMALRMGDPTTYLAQHVFGGNTWELGLSNVTWAFTAS